MCEEPQLLGTGIDCIQKREGSKQLGFIVVCLLSEKQKWAVMDV